MGYDCISSRSLLILTLYLDSLLYKVAGLTLHLGSLLLSGWSNTSSRQPTLKWLV